MAKKMSVNITIKLTDLRRKALAHDIEDVQAWIQGIADAKADNLKRVLMVSETAKRMADPSVKTMPADEDALLNALFDDREYKNAAGRAAAAAADRLAKIEEAKAAAVKAEKDAATRVAVTKREAAKKSLAAAKATAAKATKAEDAAKVR